jgi:hypothetical protein
MWRPVKPQGYPKNWGGNKCRPELSVPDKENPAEAGFIVRLNNV